jgi:hypothetical protein
MYNSDTELIFPPRIIPELRNLRTDGWQTLIDKIEAAQDCSVEKAAFVLMMARLNGCTTCHTDSFRALQGCTACSRLTLKHRCEKDADLIGLFHETEGEVQEYFELRGK